MKITEICENLDNVLPNVRWDEEGSNAIREAVRLLKTLPAIPVYADCEGTVEETHELKHYGKTVLVTNEMHGDRLVKSRYCHIMGDIMKEGKHIGQGDLIGFIKTKGEGTVKEERIPADIYWQCVAIAKSYYTMIRRRQQQEEMILQGSPAADGQPKGSGTGNPTARKAERLLTVRERNDQKIRAVERAFYRMKDKCAQDVIRKNLFEGVRMNYIDLPVSERTMKRYRSAYIRFLAQELGEI